MRLLCCIVTHNRPEYSLATIKSWLAGCGEGDALYIADNASDPPTFDALGDERPMYPHPSKDGSRGGPIFARNERNLFPGAATNIGWHECLSYGDFDLLMRSDNDIEYLPGWRQEVEAAFTAHPALGQLGVLNLHEDYDGNQPVTPWEENGHTLNVASPWVGGNCVIRRELWDEGLRWDSNPWRPGKNEDTLMSQAIHDLGWQVARVIPTIANNQSFHRYDDYPDYYRFTASLRGLVPELSV